MIIENGYIQFESYPRTIETNTGYATPTNPSTSEPIPCQWYINTQNLTANQGLGEGSDYSETSYIILIEKVDDWSRQTRVRLNPETDRMDVISREIISIEPLDAVNQLRIKI